MQIVAMSLYVKYGMNAAFRGYTTLLVLYCRLLLVSESFIWILDPQILAGTLSQIAALN